MNSSSTGSDHSSPARMAFTTLCTAICLVVAVVATTYTMARAETRLRPVSAVHRIVILIDSDDEKVMGHAISYSMNLARYFTAKKEKLTIEVVANGSGIKLLRADISPLQEPLVMLRQAQPDIVLSMCDSSRQIAEQKEGHPIELVPGARLVPFGIGRVVDLEEAGWTYIRG